MRSAIFRHKSSFLARPPRWPKRLLYGLAFFGAVALSGLTFMVYLALQVPEEKLQAGIAFPHVLSSHDKTEPIPDVNADGTEKPPTVGSVPTYALYYSSSPEEQERLKLEAPRPRPRMKPEKRTPATLKAKKSS
ncbi:MAG: hypothetical protein FJ135_07800 [Deltaproteobacteria bacterium]|nr:hypothetical protein [Deltaproteobacteria bacterium]